LSFQDPETVAEGLSLIWDEKQKWAMIAGAIGWARTGATLLVDEGGCEFRQALRVKRRTRPQTNEQATKHVRRPFGSAARLAPKFRKAWVETKIRYANTFKTRKKKSPVWIR
jgi:hypothetical protein